MFGLTGTPQVLMASSVCAWAVKPGPPSTAPSWYAQNARLRLAVIDASFCRSEPAPALRGFANSRRSLGFLALVQRDEGGGRHVDLAAHLDRRRDLLPLELLGDGVDRLHVGGDVLADPAVAPGRAPDELAALVEERHGDAVDLQLAHVGDVARDVALHALAPRRQLVEREGVVERHHRHLVLDGGELRARGAADLLRRRVRRPQLGVLLLDGPQLDDEGVVLGVGDLRRVELVVLPVVVLDGRPELVGAGDRVPLAVGQRQAPAESRAAIAWSCTRSAIRRTRP